MSVSWPGIVLDLANVVGVGRGGGTIRVVEGGVCAPPFWLLWEGLGQMMGPRRSTESVFVVGSVGVVGVVMRWSVWRVCVVLLLLSHLVIRQGSRSRVG